MRLRAVLQTNGKTATGIHVPDEVVAGFGSNRRPAVRVTINAHTYRSTIAPMGGRYMLPVSSDNRAGAGIAAGDEVDVDIELDTEPRHVVVPPDLERALAAEPDARRFFDSISFSQQRWFVESVEGAKKAETRERRVADAIGRLREGRGQR